MLTQTPRSPSSSASLSLIAAAARRSTLKVPIRLIWITFVNISRLCGPPLWATRSAQPTPAQQTEIRRPPSPSAARSTAAATASASVTSVATKLAASPSSAASASPFSALRSAIVTAAPAATSARAVASPSPEAPPATSADVPSIRIGSGSLIFHRPVIRPV